MHLSRTHSEALGKKSAGKMNSSDAFFRLLPMSGETGVRALRCCLLRQIHLDVVISRSRDAAFDGLGLFGLFSRLGTRFKNGNGLDMAVCGNMFMMPARTNAPAALVVQYGAVAC